MNNQLAAADQKQVLVYERGIITSREFANLLLNLSIELRASEIEIAEALDLMPNDLVRVSMS